MAVILVALLWWNFSGSSGDAGENKDIADPHEAWAYIQLFVEQELKSPASADFPFGGFRDVRHAGSGRFEFDSYVDSANSFGAVIRTRFQGTIQQVDGGWKMIDLRFDD